VLSWFGASDIGKYGEVGVRTPYSSSNTHDAHLLDSLDLIPICYTIQVRRALRTMVTAIALDTSTYRSLAC
jgi:hypothetical protein